MLMALHRGGKKGLQALVQEWATELRGVLFLTGSQNLQALRAVTLVRNPEA
jgi:isopentenyl diphosphate isomerase/L-lactate dehydrogenase-like FMN-dependent dehydrogenase